MNVKVAIVTGISVVLFYGVLYSVDRGLIFKPIVLASYLFTLAGMVYAILHEKRVQSPSPVEFRAAFSAAFLVLVVSNLIYLVSYNLMVYAIDPTLLPLEKQAAIDFYRWAWQWSGSPPQGRDWEQTVRNIQQAPATFGIGNFMSSYIFGLLKGAIPALLIAAFLKSKRHRQSLKEILNREQPTTP